MDRTKRTADTPWAAVPLLDETLPTLWFTTNTEALIAVQGKGYDIQYRPKRKAKK